MSLLGGRPARRVLACAAALVTVAFACLLAPGGAAVAQLIPLPPILEPPDGGGGGNGSGGGSPGSVGGKRPSSAVGLATTGNRAELIRRLPIRSGARPGEVALSLGPDRLPRLRAGRRIGALAEVQASTTCVESSRRCVGRRYGYSPKLSARVILAGRRRSKGEGRKAIRMTPTRRVRCSQKRPNRNHHCTLVLAGELKRLSRRPPCAPDCHLNLVISARNKRARRGDVMAVVADRPNGSVAQRKSRLSLIATGPRSRSSRGQTQRRYAKRLPMSRDAGRGSRVVHSMALPKLRKGEVVRAVGTHRVDTTGLPYSAYVGSRMILAAGPRATTSKNVRRFVRGDGAFTRRNGFNCTKQASGYRSPCKVRKAGAVRIRRAPKERLFVNLISRAKPLLAKAQRSDKARLRAGRLAVTRLRGR